ncbi:MAG: lysine biosynthesis protein LysW [Caldilineaceae bacterium SB0662_bin_9]|uniref:Lysine biosynthesis protein LysW n=1 Tax=Caldilineaceae bacterium SB0662_bin_9 TaxID=2605258 RepID=A0A6B1DQV3_9CHLR|nr:lysine biosynthesis protein LysW [Caldilineaceae bacterium]MXZ23604.1 lysine biosynthesis protein LysW [Caldilineaceae bacterium SB0665_bin_21]MYA03999.1 lysine biosynthesis protein LysW [Caldilineaceae bacterium SB0664_bin_22]MYC63273.1 lysine biosynthesis protein LysW [Caldilineaceae bacterium SB0661_bin_34]MYD89531.1 lysine biosynthesis protein LysW [Caldilineaceae bacterium SB0662_bin_9]
MSDIETASGTVECPVCADDIILTDVMQNEIVECEGCAGEFEVLELDPFSLEELEEDDEDYGE